MQGGLANLAYSYSTVDASTVAWRNVTAAGVANTSK